MQTPVILIVEDEEVTRLNLVNLFQGEGYDVIEAVNGEEMNQKLTENKVSLVVMDINLPGKNGLILARELRQKENIGLIFLTGRDSEVDRILGLEIGADDYVTKPFSLEEVVARLRGLIRRSTLTVDANESPVLVVGDLELDEDSHEVRRAGRLIELTATEFELLRYLMRNPRRVVSKSQILDRVWDYDFGGKSSVVEIYISYLRKKIDAEGSPMLHTVRGAGYMIKPAE